MKITARRTTVPDDMHRAYHFGSPAEWPVQADFDSWQKSGNALTDVNPCLLTTDPKISGRREVRMKTTTEVKFIAPYETGHQEWLWIDPRAILAGDHMAGAIAIAWR